jgi:hypothetical protein
MWRTLMILAAVTPALLAQGGANCKKVGGAVSTNFLDLKNPTETLGTATGDLKGALGVTVLSLSPGPNGTAVFLNHHHWVTETGDTLYFENALATAFPTPIPGLYAAIYKDGQVLTGGTGRFEGASGKITSWGAVDLSKGQVVLRYEGQVCFPPVTGEAGGGSH